MKVLARYTNGKLIEGTENTDEQWPLWAKALRQFSTPEDKGIGDVVARIIGNENSIAFKAWFESTFKRKCGCTGRQAQWNLRYPLNV